MSQIIVEGSKVAYCGGYNRDGLDIGDEGKVLLFNGNSAHVLMTTGNRTGGAVLVSPDDITVIATPRNSIEDSLYDGTIDESNLSTVAVRNVYDRGGEEGLINALANAGELPNFDGVAEEAIVSIAQHIRSHPILRSVISNLDEDEADNFVNRITLNALDAVLGG